MLFYFFAITALANSNFLSLSRLQTKNIMSFVFMHFRLFPSSYPFAHSLSSLLPYCIFYHLYFYSTTDSLTLWPIRMIRFSSCNDLLHDFILSSKHACIKIQSFIKVHSRSILSAYFTGHNHHKHKGNPLYNLMYKVHVNVCRVCSSIVADFMGGSETLA